ASNLYLGLKVQNATVGASTLDVQFDADHNGIVHQEGEDDVFVNSAGTFYDRFWHQVTSGRYSLTIDTTYGGTNDGNEWDADQAGYSFYELSHPLNDADDAHDFSLAVP